MNSPVLAIFDSGMDIGIVILVALLLFGGTQLPKLARSLGSAQQEFKKGLEEGASSTETKAKTPTATEVK